MIGSNETILGIVVLLTGGGLSATSLVMAFKKEGDTAAGFGVLSIIMFLATGACFWNTVFHS